MEEQLLKEAKAQYFQSATHMKEGFLILTSRRLLSSGTQARVRFNHGAMGNLIRDKMEEAMGYGNEGEEAVFDLPLAKVKVDLRRFGLSKRLVVTDAQGTEYKLMLNVPKAERDTWPAEVEKAKIALPAS